MTLAELQEISSSLFFAIKIDSPAITMTFLSHSSLCVIGRTCVFDFEEVISGGRFDRSTISPGLRLKSSVGAFVICDKVAKTLSLTSSLPPSPFSPISSAEEYSILF